MGWCLTSSDELPAEPFALLPEELHDHYMLSIKSRQITDIFFEGVGLFLYQFLMA